jgi:hypothetical protein
MSRCPNLEDIYPLKIAQDEGWRSKAYLDSNDPKITGREKISTIGFGTNIDTNTEIIEKYGLDPLKLKKG